ncbi:MAG: DUF3048 domain-containing protein, partial [Acidimicrobiales bacterium]
RPVLVVKIDNAPLARPQAGLNQADVVVEEMVEGGVTRLAVMFHSQDAGDVGPVRSARSTDVAVVSALNNPLFAYSGANGDFTSLVRAAPLVDIGVNTRPGLYRRVAGRPAPYNQFSTTDALFAQAAGEARPPEAQFTYRCGGSALTAAGAQPARGVRLVFQDRVTTDVQYEWDASGWARTQNGTAHVDTAGVRVAPQNVVLHFAPYRDTGYVDQSGAPVPEAEIVGEGEAWIFTDGQVVQGRWSKPAPTAVPQYVDGAGKPVALTPGRTWVELPPPGIATLLS